MYKRIIVLLLNVIVFTLMLNVKTIAAGRTYHNTDVMFIIFGAENEAQLSNKDIETYKIISDAVYYAIDENGQHLQNGYYDFVNRVKCKNPQIAKILPDANEFPSLGGGNHRIYCHQGFYHSYNLEDEQKYNNRWELGRDRILIPAVAAAFDLNYFDQEDKAKSEALSVIAYYSHILGDINIGNTSQMKNVSSYKKMIPTMSKDISTALGKCKNTYCKNYQMEQVKNLKNHDAVRDYMRGNFERIIDVLSGKVQEESIFDKIGNWIKRAA